MVIHQGIMRQEIKWVLALAWTIKAVSSQFWDNLRISSLTQSEWGRVMLARMGPSTVAWASPSKTNPCFKYNNTSRIRGTIRKKINLTTTLSISAKMAAHPIRNHNYKKHFLSNKNPHQDTQVTPMSQVVVPGRSLEGSKGKKKTKAVTGEDVPSHVSW